LVTSFAFNLLEEQLTASHDYTVQHLGDGYFLVALTPDALATAMEAAKKNPRIGHTHYRGRIVKTRVAHGVQLYLICPCGWYQQYLLPCRHILRIKDGNVAVQFDIHPQWFQSYGTPGLPPVLRYANEGTLDGPSLEGLDPAVVKEIEAVFRSLQGGVPPPQPDFIAPMTSVPGLEECEDWDDDVIEAPTRTGGKSRYGEFLDLANVKARQLASVQQPHTLTAAIL
jgi:hypothetical protein